jgi:GTP-binding protein Era
VNALVGKKIVITSHHPNTTRNPIRGIISKPDYHMILVDTPGVHKPKTLLGTRLNAMVAENLESVDAALICLPVDEAIGAGDEFIVKQLGHIRNIFIAVTKVDKATKPEILIEKLVEVSGFVERLGITVKEIVPVSAKREEQTGLLMELLSTALPSSPSLYPEDISTDQAAELTITELIREAAIEDLYEELPHSVMITIDEFEKREGKNFFDIHATLHVERDSQKSIIIGPQGSRLKAIGTTARGNIENFLDAKIFLGLHVKVSKEWQRDPKALARMGFTE